jgi:hypothetical protein
MKINVGDIIAVKLLNGLHLFVQIMYRVPSIKHKDIEKINQKSYLVQWFSGFYLINVYRQISKNNILENSEIMYKGLFLHKSDINKSEFEILSHNKINVEEIEFPETIGNLEDGYFFQKGELIIPIRNYTKKFEKDLKNGPLGSFKDIYSIGDSVLYAQNRKNEMQREYYDGWKHTPSDLRYYQKLRNEIYKLIKEDPNQSYYNMALKYGYDLKRLYEIL